MTELWGFLRGLGHMSQSPLGYDLRNVEDREEIEELTKRSGCVHDQPAIRRIKQSFWFCNYEQRDANTYIIEKCLKCGKELKRTQVEGTIKKIFITEI